MDSGEAPSNSGTAADESGDDVGRCSDCVNVLSASAATTVSATDSEVTSEVYDAIEDLAEESGVSDAEAEECGGDLVTGGHAGMLQRVLSSDAILVRGLSLAPVPMTPHQLSRATEIQLFLERVEFIEIRDVIERDENIIYYVVGIYRYQQQKGIPTRRRASSATPPPPPATATLLPSPLQLEHVRQERKPDYQIEQRYSSFARLRRNVANIARKRHPHGRSCAYCHSVLHFLQTTPAKPCLKVKFASSVDERKAILGSFISELVYAVREAHTDCARSMHGYHMIPALVRRFLAEQTGANFFRY